MYAGRSKMFILSATVFLLLGCSTRPTYYIKLQLQGNEVPCQGVQIEFSSYNYMVVLDSLTKQNNPGARPDSTELMELVATYQTILEKSARMADAVDTLRDALEKLDSKSVDYRKKYPLFQRLDKELQERMAERQQIHERYLEAKGSYDMKLKDWQGSAFKGFGDFKSKIIPEFQTKVEVTDKDCMVKKLGLPYTRWWLHCEERKPGSANEKLIWDLEMPVGADSLMIILDESSAKVVKELL